MVVGGGDVGELGGDLVERALPQVAGERQHVGLVDQRQVVARPRRRQLEGVAHAPLDTQAGVHAALGGDLVRRSPPQHTALADVGALGVLADDDEVVAPAR